MKNQQHKDQTHYPKAGLFFLFVFQIVILFMYGFYTSYSALIPYTLSLEYIFTNVLAVLGFGLLLTYFKYTVKQTIIVSLVVCFVNIQLGPLIQAFWYKVFISGFHQTYAVIPGNSFSLLDQTPVLFIRGISLSFLRISTFCSISLLVALTSVIGKIGLLNSFITSIVFNIGWNLSYYLNYMIYLKRGLNQSTFFIFDDFQGSRVFMFGAGFGLALLIVYSRANSIERPPQPTRVIYTDQFSRLFSLLGTCFVIAMFYYIIDTYTPQSKPTALLNIIFAFSGSILSSVAISCILGGTITFHHINMTIISGVIQISIIGGFIQTAYVALLVGAFAGIVSGLLSHFLFNKSVTDSKGLIIVYLINCVLCAYFICPIIIKAYKNFYTNTASFKNYNQGFYMAYTTISFGIGLATGFIAGVFRCCIKQTNNLSDTDFFRKSYLTHYLVARPPFPKPVEPESLSRQQIIIYQSRLPVVIQQEALTINL